MKPPIKFNGETFDDFDALIAYVSALAPMPYALRKVVMEGPPHRQPCLKNCKACNAWFERKKIDRSTYPIETWNDYEYRKQRFYRAAWIAAVFTVAGYDVFSNTEVLDKAIEVYNNTRIKGNGRKHFQNLRRIPKFVDLYSNYTMTILQRLGKDPVEILRKGFERLERLAVPTDAQPELLEKGKDKLDALRLYLLTVGEDLTLPEDRPRIASGGVGTEQDAYYEIIGDSFEPPQLPANGKESKAA